jgi:hypothetical protein
MRAETFRATIKTQKMMIMRQEKKLLLVSLHLFTSSYDTKSRCLARSGYSYTNVKLKNQLFVILVQVFDPYLAKQVSLVFQSVLQQEGKFLPSHLLHADFLLG